LLGTTDTWLLWHLTAGKVHVTDINNASRTMHTMLYDIYRQCWDEELLDLFGVPASMLPDVRGCSEVDVRMEAKFFFGRVVPICGIAAISRRRCSGKPVSTRAWPKYLWNWLFYAAER
jgi:glycerol kinase